LESTSQIAQAFIHLFGIKRIFLLGSHQPVAF
jgi:hypothetical protein